MSKHHSEVFFFATHHAIHNIQDFVHDDRLQRRFLQSSRGIVECLGLPLTPFGTDDRQWLANAALFSSTAEHLAWDSSVETLNTCINAEGQPLLKAHAQRFVVG